MKEINKLNKFLVRLINGQREYVNKYCYNYIIKNIIEIYKNYKRFNE